MMNQKIILLLSVLLTSCLGNYHYHKKLYSGEVKERTRIGGKLIKDIFTSDYFILENVFIQGQDYEIMTANWAMYDLLKNCNIIDDFNEYEKFMLKHRKKGITLDSTCYKSLMNYTIDSEVCNSIDMNPYDYIDKDGYLKENINDRDSVRCIIRSLLLSENLFIESNHGEIQIKRKHEMDDS